MKAIEKEVKKSRKGPDGNMVDVMIKVPQPFVHFLHLIKVTEPVKRTQVVKPYARRYFTRV